MLVLPLSRHRSILLFSPLLPEPFTRPPALFSRPSSSPSSSQAAQFPAFVPPSGREELCISLICPHRVIASSLTPLVRFNNPFTLLRRAEDSHSATLSRSPRSPFSESTFKHLNYQLQHLKLHPLPHTPAQADFPLLVQRNQPKPLPQTKKLTAENAQRRKGSQRR